MSTTTAFGALVRAETRMVVRDTAGLVVPFALPTLLLVMNAAAFGDQEVGGGRTVVDVHVLPVVVAVVVTMVGVVNMPSFLVTYRRTGILRRLAVTPVAPSLVLAAQVVVGVVQALLGIAVAYAVAVAAFGASPPSRVGALLGVLALSIAATYALGALVAAVAPTPSSAVAGGLVLFFALGTLGGMFGSTDVLPDVLARIGEVLPFGATVAALAAASGETALPVAPMVGLAVTAVVAAGAATWTFRWDR
ncbi:ABC transporter permease [Nocardioides zeae]|uniref:ABC transporter permease n=1 Tax=Nocardioides imazamoxiresistens TaxID=3231893 RepID=A0ABU3Q0Q0_9ACTN|nr:ABC transporter permease [Nocardioides zeae]MDT9595085.1 ABC transporter permease [Nocardioides zeae]